MKIVVLAGGISHEREVSLSTGSLVANALIEKGHDVVLLDAYMGLDINIEEINSIFHNNSNGLRYKYQVGTEEPNLQELKEKSINESSLIGKNVISICQYADVVFNALHGGIGEDGKIQALFDILGIKYTGSGYIGSLLAMDKDLTKRLLINAGIKTAEWVLFNVKEKENYSKVICETIGFPCVVKPCSNGSSIGVSIINNEKQLKSAISEIGEYESNVLIEKFIKGKEFSVGILENEVLPVIEIIPKDGFYDYKNKYQAGFTEEICPARLSNMQTETIKKLAKEVHKVLRLGNYSRIDFILSEEEFICLEANSLPGMTPTSLLPQEAKACGINYNELCERIVLMGYQK